MKNIALFVLPLTLGFISCDNNKGGEPVITIDSIYVDGVSRGCDLSEPISSNSTIRVFTTLATESGTLVSFNTQADCGDGSDSGICPVTSITEYEKETVSDDISNLSQGTIRFKDGVVKTNVAVETSLPDVLEQDLHFKLYLTTTGNNNLKKELNFKIVNP